MSGFGTTPPRDPNSKRDFYQESLAPGCPLKVARAKTDSLTIFRPTPEIRDGHALPMAIGQDDYGPVFSALREEPMVICSGVSAKWSGFTSCSDRPGASEFDLPWNGLFIKVKGLLNKNKVPDADLAFVHQMLDKPQNASAPLQNVSKNIFIQGVCLQLNGTPCPTPMAPAVLVVGGSAKAQLIALMSLLAQTGQDLFSWDNGYTIKVSGVKVGNQVPTFKVDLGDKMPIPASWQPNCPWIPWESAIKYRSYDDHVKQLYSCYGPRLLSMCPPLVEAMARLGLQGAPAATTYVAPAGAYQVQPAAPQAPAGNPFGGAQTAPAQPFVQPAAPQAPAGNPFAGTQPAAPAGNPFAAAPAAAPAGNPFGAAPAQPVAPAVQAGPTPAVAPATAADLQKSYQSLIAPK